MIVKNKILLGFLFVCFSTICFGQDTVRVYLIKKTNNVNGINDWPKVKIKIMPDSALPRTFGPYGGNGVLTIPYKINTVNDLQEKDSKKIKMNASSHNCATIFFRMSPMMEHPPYYTYFYIYCNAGNQ